MDTKKKSNRNADKQIYSQWINHHYVIRYGLNDNTDAIPTSFIFYWWTITKVSFVKLIFKVCILRMCYLLTGRTEHRPVQCYWHLNYMWENVQWWTVLSIDGYLTLICKLKKNRKTMNTPKFSNGSKLPIRTGYSWIIANCFSAGPFRYRC